MDFINWCFKTLEYLFIGSVLFMYTFMFLSVIAIVTEIAYALITK